MKKLIKLLTVLTIALIFASCGNVQSSDKEITTTTTISSITTSTLTTTTSCPITSTVATTIIPNSETVNTTTSAVTSKITTTKITTTPCTTTTFKPTTTITTTTANTTSYTPFNESTMYVKGDVNVRTRADVNSKSLGTLSKGVSLTVIGELGNWYAINYNGQTAFVSKTYISSTKPITTTITSKATTTTTTRIITNNPPVSNDNLPSSVDLKVDCILQKSGKSMPTGCEATALTIALNYYGFNVDKYTIAMEYLPRMTFSNGYGANFQYVFAGKPTDNSSYGCYAPAIVATANAYFNDIKNASYAQNISGTEFTKLYEYIASENPVIIWGTMDMVSSYLSSSWKTPDEKNLTWRANEHCLVLIGYDKNAGTVTVSDPLKGNCTLKADLVEKRYNEMGKYAVILHTTDENKGESDIVTSGSVYKIKNAQSGLYLTVAGNVAKDGTNLIQSKGNNKNSQNFKILYDKKTNSYKIYTMCSNDNVDRVIDIVKIGGWVVGGSNVQVYNPCDISAQTFVIEDTKDGKVKFSCRTNRNGCLAVKGNSEGSANGKSYSSKGNVVIQYYSGSDNQLWYLEEVK